MLPPLQGSSYIPWPTQGFTLGYGLKVGLSALSLERPSHARPAHSAAPLRSTHAPEGQKLPAQGKRAKRRDTLGFAELRPIRPGGAKAAAEPVCHPLPARVINGIRPPVPQQNPSVPAFAPLGRIGRHAAKPRVSHRYARLPWAGCFCPFVAWFERPRQNHPPPAPHVAPRGGKTGVQRGGPKG